jgi:hypothetical protein
MSSFLENTLMLVPKRCIGPFQLGMKVEEALKYLIQTSQDSTDWDDILGFSDHRLKMLTDDWDGYLPGAQQDYVQLSFSKDNGKLVLAGFAKGADVVFYGIKLLQVPQNEAIKVLIKYGGAPIEVEPGCYDWLTLGVRTYNASNPSTDPFECVSIRDYSDLQDPE